MNILVGSRKEEMTYAHKKWCSEQAIYGIYRTEERLYQLSAEQNVEVVWTVGKISYVQTEN